MRLDGEFAECQAQARRHLAARLAALHLPELFEYAVERLRRDALAGVADAEQQGSVAGLGRCRDRPAGGRELDGIPQQIDQGPAQLVLVAGEGRQVQRGLLGQRQAVRLGQHGDLGRGPPDQARRRERDLVQRYRLLFHLFHIQQVVDHAQQCLTTVHGDVYHLGLDLVHVADQRHGLEAGKQGSQRGPQIVDDHVGQVVAQALQLLELPVAFSEFRCVAQLAVAGALLAQAGPDAGAQQGGVERLGQIVGRPHLDAAHDAVRFVQGGDHDDGQPLRPGVVLDARKHLIAVHVRHHDIQQDDVEGLLGQCAQRFSSARRRDGPVALFLQAAGQNVPVLLVIVHDEHQAAFLALTLHITRGREAGRQRLGAHRRRVGGHVGGAKDGGVQALVHERQQALAGGVDLLDIRDQVRPVQLAQVVHDHLAVAEDMPDWVPQIVP